MKKRVHTILGNVVEICPKSGRLIRFKSPKGAYKLLFPILGLASLIWILIRVIPKPSRAGYPCMKVATPIATGFLAYMVGLAASAFAFHKARKRFRQSRYAVAAFFVVLGLIGTLWMTVGTPNKATLAKTLDETPNTPIGTAVGIHPGRVTWVHNTDATNENCTNANSDYWWTDDNNNQEVIDGMVSEAVCQLTGDETPAEAWDALFKYHNNKKGKGEVGYQPGEMIAIKINLGCEWSRSVDSKGNWRDRGNNLYRSDSTPHVVLSVLKQLVNEAGVQQQDIYIGDFIRNFAGPFFDKCNALFPDVNYMQYSANYDGRTKLVASDDPVVFYSDGKDNDHLPTILLKADYFINVPVWKAHARAGITATAKNHFGSHCRSGASHLHRSLPSAADNGTMDNGEMGSYRCLVDMLGHQYIGGNTMLVLLDGLWSASEATDPPVKWESAPFNGDWPNSILAAQDQVAMESVCYDFLSTEFTVENHPTVFTHTDNKLGYPAMPGVQDYIHQAADPANWPEGLTYDPENDGTPLTSLGVHEHWNNPVDKQYSRDLGTGDGIELVKVFQASDVTAGENRIEKSCRLYDNYPNPFNPQTTIQYELNAPSEIGLTIYNQNGQLIRTLTNSRQTAGLHQVIWDGVTDQGGYVASGIYIYQLRINGAVSESKQMVLMQ